MNTSAKKYYFRTTYPTYDDGNVDSNGNPIKDFEIALMTPKEAYEEKKRLNRIHNGNVSQTLLSYKETVTLR